MKGFRELTKTHHMAALLLCLLSASMVIGCRPPHPKQVAFKELPRISDLTDTRSTRPCIYMRTGSPHVVTIWVLGEASSQPELYSLFPLLEAAMSHPHADVLCSRMPNGLLAEVNKRGGLLPPARFWYLAESTNAPEGFSGYIAFSESSRIFYLEYSWPQ